MINKLDNNKCLFISGVADNKQDSFLVETYYYSNNTWLIVKITIIKQQVF